MVIRIASPLPPYFTPPRCASIIDATTQPEEEGREKEEEEGRINSTHIYTTISVHPSIDTDPPTPSFVEEHGPAHRPRFDFRVLGKAQGQRHDYDHTGMLVHKAAEGDHFTSVLEWVRRHD